MTKNFLKFQLYLIFAIIENKIYKIKSIPWGIPNIFTNKASFSKYLMGTAIKSNKI